MLSGKTFLTFSIFLCKIHLNTCMTSVLYEAGILREYSSFRNVLPYMFTVPQDAQHASFMFRSSKSPDSCDIRKVQIQFQFGSLPLGKNETFPDHFYLDRADVEELNIHSDNKTTEINLSHPLPGDWFAIAYIPDKDTRLRPKGLFPTCYYSFHVDFTSLVEDNIDGIHLFHDYKASVSKNQPVIYRFTIAETSLTYQVHLTGCKNSSGASINCSTSIYTRGQGIPDTNHYDNQYNCDNADHCVVSVPVLFQHGFQYLLFMSSTDVTFTFNVSITECESGELTSRTDSESCVMYPLMDRYEYQGVFNIKYMYIVNGTEVKKPYILSENTTLIVPYEIRSGQDNGGSVILKLSAVADQKMMNSDVHVLVKGCLHRTLPERSIHSDCPSTAAQISVNTSTSPVVQDSVVVPYPKAGTWFTSMKMSCFVQGTNESVIVVPCNNRTVNITLDIKADRCVEGKCNDKGSCAVYLQGRLLVSTCVCQGGWSGYSCNDGSDLIPFNEQLIEIVLLVTSHVMFIPAIIFALYRTHYVEAFVYFYTMFFSAFYHACDGNRNAEYKYCLINIGVLSFCDFLGSLTSIWVTLVGMTKLPRVIRSVLYAAGPLLFAVGIELQRTSFYLFVIPGALGVFLIAVTWVYRCYKRHKCYPPCRRYLMCLLPGLLIAGGGLCIFGFAENNTNYKYTHSAWHMLMATCTIFLLPPRPKKRDMSLRTADSGSCVCLADDPNSTILATYRDSDSLENLII